MSKKDKEIEILQRALEVRDFRIAALEEALKRISMRIGLIVDEAWASSEDIADLFEDRDNESSTPL